MENNRKVSSSLRATNYALRTKRGFTLIEILIVVGIIGLLASVVLSGLGSVRSRGRDARRAADLRQVQQGLELYYTRFQEYPDGSNWDTLREVLRSANIGITNISSDPLCGNANSPCTDDYSYFSANKSEYILQAFLEDKASPLAKDSYGRLPGDQQIQRSSCGKIAGNRIYYCIKF